MLKFIRLYLCPILFVAIFPLTCTYAAEPTSKKGLLPEHRIVAYYGNFNSAKMGVLGEYPPEQVLKMLKAEVAKWEAADPATPVIPAIDYITVIAQKDAGRDKDYNARMSDAQIEKAIGMANELKGIAILDIQVAQSNVRTEIPLLAAHLALPNVMLAIDPEFSMKSGEVPGTKIGSLDAADINYAANYLADIVRKHNLPPKVLIIHRFTQHMVTNAHLIKPLPEVQIVIDMDGWGPGSLKTDSYRAYVEAEPVQFTGIKLFYKNDLKAPSKGLMTPEEILKLKPVPSFILYQ